MTDELSGINMDVLHRLKERTMRSEEPIRVRSNEEKFEHLVGLALDELIRRFDEPRTTDAPEIDPLAGPEAIHAQQMRRMEQHFNEIRTPHTLLTLVSLYFKRDPITPPFP